MAHGETPPLDQPCSLIVELPGMPPLPGSSTVSEQYAAGEKLRFNRSSRAIMHVDAPPCEAD